MPRPLKQPARAEPSYMRVPGSPTAAAPFIRCPNPAPIHTLRVVRGNLRTWERAMRTMMRMGLAGVAVMMACNDDPATAPVPVPPLATVFSATGPVGGTVNQFRAILGAANGGTAGEQPAGRREINWDGAAAIPFNNRNDFPADFFNTTVKAGAVFTTPGTGFRNDSTLFSEVNPTYAAQFLFFTASEIFAAVGSNQLDQEFRVAGQPTPALVRGFGIVFSDVDDADKTTIQLFAQDGSSLGTYSANS